MNKLKSLMTRIIGCVEIALVCTFIFGGMIAFTVRMLFDAEVSINVFVVIFIMILSMLLACVGLYYVNSALWDKIHEKRDDLSLFKMIPDIRVIVDFVEYVGNHVGQNDD